MLTEDHLMRMIRIATATLAKVIGLKAALLYTDAMFMIDDTLEQITGLKTNVLDQMDDDSLLAFISGPDGPDFGRLVVTADLFNESADIRLSLHESENAKVLYLRALFLYMEAVLIPDNPTPKSVIQEVVLKIERILQTVPPSELPSNLLYSLFCLYEQENAFRSADITLDLLLTINGNSFEMIEEVQSFYQRMLSLSDSDLEKGGLTRQEILSRLQ